MNKPHPHCDLIKLWADGNEIQQYHGKLGGWIDEPYPSWYPDDKYRVKPEPYEAHVNVYLEVATAHPTKIKALANKGPGCIRTVHVREVEE